MSIKTFEKAFTERLIACMKKKGLTSSRSKTGVNHSELAKALGKSDAFASLVVSGARLPSAAAILEISKWLDVSPGWLLFGNDTGKEGDLISIDGNLLEEIIERLIALEPETLSSEDFAKFVRELIADAALLEADLEIKRKLIEKAFSSASFFSKNRTLKTK